jgi:hypothetical protein
VTQFYAISSQRSRDYLRALPFRKRRSFATLYPNANPQAIDFLNRCLTFESVVLLCFGFRVVKCNNCLSARSRGSRWKTPWRILIWKRIMTQSRPPLPCSRGRSGPELMCVYPQRRTIRYATRARVLRNGHTQRPDLSGRTQISALPGDPDFHASRLREERCGTFNLSSQTNPSVTLSFRCPFFPSNYIRSNTHKDHDQYGYAWQQKATNVAQKFSCRRLPPLQSYPASSVCRPPVLAISYESKEEDPRLPPFPRSPLSSSCFFLLTPFPSSRHFLPISFVFIVLWESVVAGLVRGSTRSSSPFPAAFFFFSLQTCSSVLFGL